MVAIMRISWLVYHCLYPGSITKMDIFVAAVRISILLTLIYLYCRNLGDARKHQVGKALLWVVRIYAIVAAVLQVAADHSDPQIMSSLVTVCCFIGLAIPTYLEYLCYALPLPFVRPLCFVLQSANADHLQDVLFQHMLILALGASITASVHSDCRRGWLRSRSSGHRKGIPPEERARLSAVRRDSVEDKSGADEEDWGELTGCCGGCAAAAALRAEAQQARVARPRRPRATPLRTHTSDRAPVRAVARSAPPMKQSPETEQ